MSARRPRNAGAAQATKRDAVFLEKTYNIIEQEDSSVVEWAEDGKSFVVKDPDYFAKRVIPLYFKHSKFASFVRQLNFYGFRKLPVEGWPNTTCNTSKWWQFSHPRFVRGQPEVLPDIKRKTYGHSAVADATDVSRLQDEVKELKRQVAELQHVVRGLAGDTALGETPLFERPADADEQHREHPYGSQPGATARKRRRTEYGDGGSSEMDGSSDEGMGAVSDGSGERDCASASGGGLLSPSTFDYRGSTGALFSPRTTLDLEIGDGSAVDESDWAQLLQGIALNTSVEADETAASAADVPQKMDEDGEDAQPGTEYGALAAGAAQARSPADAASASAARETAAPADAPVEDAAVPMAEPSQAQTATEAARSTNANAEADAIEPKSQPVDATRGAVPGAASAPAASAPSARAAAAPPPVAMPQPSAPESLTAAQLAPLVQTWRSLVSGLASLTAAVPSGISGSGVAGTLPGAAQAPAASSTVTAMAPAAPVAARPPAIGGRARPTLTLAKVAQPLQKPAQSARMQPLPAQPQPQPALAPTLTPAPQQPTLHEQQLASQAMLYFMQHIANQAAASTCIPQGADQSVANLQARA